MSSFASWSDNVFCPFELFDWTRGSEVALLPYPNLTDHSKQISLIFFVDSIPEPMELFKKFKIVDIGKDKPTSSVSGTISTPLHVLGVLVTFMFAMWLCLQVVADLSESFTFMFTFVVTQESWTMMAAPLSNFLWPCTLTRLKLMALCCLMTAALIQMAPECLINSVEQPQEFKTNLFGESTDAAVKNRKTKMKPNPCLSLQLKWWFFLCHWDFSLQHQKVSSWSCPCHWKCCSIEESDKEHYWDWIGLDGSNTFHVWLSCVKGQKGNCKECITHLIRINVLSSVLQKTNIVSRLA